MKWLKRIAAFVSVAVLCSGGLIAVMAARFEPTIQPDVAIGPVAVGGLSRADAAKKLRAWWDTERRSEIRLTSPKLSAQPPVATLTSYGVGLDDLTSVEQAPLDEFWLVAKRSFGIEKAPKILLEPRFTFNESKTRKLSEFVESQSTGFEPARVVLRGKQIERYPEKTGLALDLTGLQNAVMTAWKSGGKGTLPLVESPKRIPDEDLSQIADVVSSFTTSFSTAKRTRCHNIQLASKKIDGIVLAPGDTFSFNGTVGRRTQQAGFQIAGVYRNGRHDFDVGGGICQVSTTLYNAALLANLEIVQRSNHSMPVAYVPLGRDATVDYGSRDLVIKNNLAEPVAITCLYQPGKLTFSILGLKDDSISVKILSGGRRTWSAGVKYVTDSSLAPGKTKTVDKGGIGASISTTRIVYKNGVEVSRQPLGQSYYRGGQRIIARGPAAMPSAVPEPPSTDEFVP